MALLRHFNRVSLGVLDAQSAFETDAETPVRTIDRIYRNLSNSLVMWSSWLLFIFHVTSPQFGARSTQAGRIPSLFLHPRPLITSETILTST